MEDIALAKAISKWLYDRVNENPKLNPVPYNLFEALLSKQIAAGRQKGKHIDFVKLSDAVKHELMKSGILVMPSPEKTLKPIEEKPVPSSGNEQDSGDDHVFNAGANMGMVIGSTVRNAGTAAVDAGVVVGKAAIDAGAVVGKAAVSAVKKAGMLTAGAVAGTLVGLFKGSGKEKK